MKKGVYIILFFLICIGSVQANFSKSLLDNFTQRHKESIKNSIPFASEDELAIFEQEKKIEMYGKVAHSIRENRKEDIQARIPVIEKQEEIQNFIKNINDDIVLSTKEIRELEKEVREINKDIIQVSESMDTITVQIENNKEKVIDYISYMYSISDSVFDENQEMDVIRGILLSDDTVTEVVNDLYFKSLIRSKAEEYIHKYDILIEEQKNKKRFLYERKNSVSEKQEELKKIRSKLVLQKEYKNKFLKILKLKEEEITDSIGSNMDIQNELREKVQKLSKEYNALFYSIQAKYGCFDDKESEECIRLENFYEAERNLRTRTGAYVNFIWPVDPKKGLTAYFKDLEYYKELWTLHEAIDIRADQGTDVRAAADGYVLAIYPPKPGGYSYVIVKHRDGFISVYGHLSEVRVHKFDFLRAGDVFALSGGAPGEDGSGPVSTGAHLHFELFKDKETVDPLRYLDISYLDLETLHSKYAYKYIEDYKKRFGKDIYSVLDKDPRFFLIGGETEQERQKNLLSVYANQSFGDWDLWDTISEKQNLDTSFLMCVGLAETGLGNYMKSRYNIGNIGNNDSGDVKHFSGPKEWVLAMGYTFNNKYLGTYTSIDQLSRWGNYDGTIYASEPVRWHDNLVRCLSAMKGEFVEDTFEFRREN